MSELKLCINCANCTIFRGIHRCTRIDAPISLVTGRQTTTFDIFCEVERISTDPEKCGSEGRFFTPKNEQKSLMTRIWELY